MRLRSTCKWAVLTAVFGFLIFAFSVRAGNLPAANTAQLSGERISGPFNSKNLSVFLIHGKDTSAYNNFLTLQEGLQSKQVIVRETGNVNELTIENLGRVAVFIQSGDIVKGGRQDRTLQYDMILPPKSGVLPINSFCVEHGRWSGRGSENAQQFNGSQHQLASKSLKMAAKYYGSQQDVWSKVSEMQSKGAAAAGVAVGSVQAPASPTSLQLTLENDKIKQSTSSYINDLSKVADGKTDVVGYAFAINGKINSIDVYACNALFKKMWPKLINASAVEALSDVEQGKTYAPPTSDQVRACMKDADQAKAKEKASAGKSRLLMQETDKNVMFETQDSANANAWVHRNYMTKH